MAVPQNYMYTDQHEWLELAGGHAKVGITAFAADALGDVVFVELPSVGTTLVAGEACGELESTKSVSDLFSPADGVVVEVNDAVIDDPGLLNTDPFAGGWLFRMEVSQAPQLLTPQDYESLTRGA